VGLLAPYRTVAGNGPLARLLIGEFVSAVGDWLYFVALLVLIYQDSPSPAFLGLVGAARQLPYVVLSPPAGMIADRFDPRLILLTSNLLRVSIMAVLTVVSLVGGSLWLVFGLAVLATCFATPSVPAIGAFLPSLVRDESEFGPANHAFATLDNLAFGIGPAMGGVLIVVGGLPIAFLLNAVAFAVGAAVVWRMPRVRGSSRLSSSPQPAPSVTRPPEATPVHPVPAVHVRAVRIGEASNTPTSLRTILGPLAGLLAFSSVTYFFTGGLEVITILIAVDLLHAGEGATGFLNAAIGIGGVVGALISGALLVRRRFEAPILLGAIAMGAGLIATGMATGATGIAFALVALAVMEAGDMVLDVSEATLLHRSVPDVFRGRAFGYMDSVRKLALVAGAIFLPVLADGGHVGPVLVGSGIVTIVACLGLVALFGVGRAGLPPVVVAAASRVPALPIFAGLAPERLEAALERMRESHVIAGQVVVRQGDPADRFYVIASGQFRVTQKGRDASSPRFLRDLGPDDVFGEIGLLRAIPRTATVTALTDGVLATLEAPDFLELVTSGAGVRARFLNLYPVSGRVPPAGGANGNRLDAARGMSDPVPGLHRA
jgi:MFS family permease